MNKKILSIGCDHAAYNLKLKLIPYLEEKGYEILDVGTDSPDSCDYPVFAKRVCENIQNGVCELGILICGTGIGMSMAANKVAGIRAANVISTEFAELAREHNNANVLCLSGRFVDLLTNEEICDVFLATSFGEGRHAPRVAKIDALD